MSTIVKMFESGDDARKAAEALSTAKRFDGINGRSFSPFAPHLVSPPAPAAPATAEGEESEAPAAAPASSVSTADALAAFVADGVLQTSEARACQRALDRGLHAVIVECAFGTAGEAQARLNAAGASTEELVPEARNYDTALFSDLLGIPLLLKNGPVTPVGKSRNGTVFGGGTSGFSLSRMLGMPMLVRNGPVLGSGLTSNPTPMSSAVGMPTVKKASSKTKLMSNPTPFSSALGLPLLTRRPGED